MKITLDTERLLLRSFKIGDALDMYEGWASDPEVTKYLTWDIHKNKEETRDILMKWITEYEKPERINFAIVLKDNNKLIGGIDVVGYEGGVQGTPIIGYVLSRKYWNNGYMTEACKKVLSYLFKKGYKEVRIDALVDNIASNKVILKCGGEFIETYKDIILGKNVLVNKYLIRK